MNTNFHYLKLLAKELHELLENKKLISFFTQDKDELILDFSTNKQPVFLKISLKNQYSNFNVIDNYSRAKKNTFDLFDEILGLSCQNVSVFENERAICLELSNNIKMVFKLFGNRPNLLIYLNQDLVYMFNKQLKTDENIVLENLNRTLDLSQEAYYESDGVLSDYNPTFGKLINYYLNENYEHYSLNTRWIHIKQFQEYLKAPDYYIVKFQNRVHLSLVEVGEILNKAQSAIEASQLFEKYYNTTYIFALEKDKLINSLNKQIQKTQSYLTETQSKLYDLENNISNESIGHILMANMHAIEADIEQVSLLNFYNNDSIIIKLKKNLSPQKNAEWYYRKSKNEKIAVQNAKENIAAANSKLAELTQDLANVQAAEDIKTLNSYIKIFQKEAELSQGIEDQFKVFYKNGYTILVGRNAKNNDVLTTKFCKKDDYWFHAKDVSGSHVVVKKKSGENISENVAEYAAGIAAYNSKRKTDSLVPVTFTQKKFIRKAKGLAVGQIIVEKEKILLVDPFEG